MGRTESVRFFHCRGYSSRGQKGSKYYGNGLYRGKLDSSASQVLTTNARARGAVLGAEFHTKERLNTDHGKQNNSFYSCHSKLQINASISRTF